MRIKIKNTRVSFASNLFSTQKFDETSTPKFGADFLIEPDTQVFAYMEGSWKETKIGNVMRYVAEEAWPGKGDRMLSSFESSKKCLRDGNKRLKQQTGEPYEGYPDHEYVTAKNAVRPKIKDRDGHTDLTADDGKLRSGYRVIAYMDIYANKNAKTMGVFACIVGVQMYAVDDTFGGGGMDDSDFEEIADVEAEGEFDPLDGLV